MLHILLLAVLLTTDPPAKSGQNPPPAPAAVERTAGTTCALYARPSSMAPMLSTVSPGMLVQVTDSSSKAFFVKAQIVKEGKTITGYMFRACLATP